MKNLKHNIEKTYGEKGLKWLEGLEASVIHYQKIWNLGALKPVEGMSYHYIAKGKGVVLKLGFNLDLMEKEALFLRLAAGKGAIRLLKEEKGALLLEEAIPGTPLKQEQEEAYLQVVDKLTIPPPLSPQDPFPELKTWLSALDKAGQLPPRLLLKAVHLKNKLLASMKNRQLLHGDLHLENILLHGREWMVIDPQGVIGEKEFEVAAFDFNTPEVILSIARKGNFSTERLKDWVFVRLMLSAAWMAEDHLDFSERIKKAELFDRI